MFEEVGPSTSKNPLPGHGGPEVNAIEGRAEERLRVDKVRIPKRFILSELCKAGMITGDVESRCPIHPGLDHDAENCEEVRELLQRLMESNLIQIVGREEDQEIMMQAGEPAGLSPKPLVVHFARGSTVPPPGGKPVVVKVPALFPYVDNKAVPWRYGIQLAEGELLKGNEKKEEEKKEKGEEEKKEEEEKQNEEQEAPVTNIAGIGGVTRSGRIYTAEPKGYFKGKAKAGEFVTEENRDYLRSQGIETHKNEVGLGEGLGNKEISTQDAHEFLRIIQ